MLRCSNCNFLVHYIFFCKKKIEKIRTVSQYSAIDKIKCSLKPPILESSTNKYIISENIDFF